MVHVLDMKGTRIKSRRPHSATINDISIDSTGEFVATASMDGGSIPFCEYELFNDFI